MISLYKQSSIIDFKICLPRINDLIRSRIANLKPSGNMTVMKALDDPEIQENNHSNY
jgi:uncharacterized protein YjgD (DUF1641 family)